MKKIAMFFAATAVMVLGSCGGSTSKTNVEIEESVAGISETKDTTVVVTDSSALAVVSDSSALAVLEEETVSNACERCKGTGKIKCKNCKGSGYDPDPDAYCEGGMFGCTKCGGTGLEGRVLLKRGKGKVKCPDCKGKGTK